MRIALGNFKSYKCDVVFSGLPHQINAEEVLKTIKSNTVFVYIAESDMTTDSLYIDNYMHLLMLKNKIEKVNKDFVIHAFHYNKHYVNMPRLYNYTFSNMDELQRLLSNL